MFVVTNNISANIRKKHQQIDKVVTIFVKNRLHLNYPQVRAVLDPFNLNRT